MRGNYGEAEVGLKEAYEDFKPLRNDAQMGYSIYHLAVMNRKRGSLRQALELYNRAGYMFEHMGSRPELIQNDTTPSRMGDESLGCQAELYARLCRPEEAKLAYSMAYSRARALLENIEGREKTALAMHSAKGGSVAITLPRLDLTIDLRIRRSSRWRLQVQHAIQQSIFRIIYLQTVHLQNGHA